MASTDAIITRLLTALSLADPTWDTSVGSVTYKIMEAVAQEFANVNDNSTLLTYGYDINSKFGTELDAFVNLFGINRQLGTRATGTVTFSTTGDAVQDYDIPLGTQVYASLDTYNSNVGYTTTSPAIVSSGQSSAVVPVIASVAGSFGNLPAGSITRIGTPLVGVTNVINEYDLTNGIDGETDAQLKQRFSATAFSNFSGTPDKLLSSALQDPNVTRASVIEAQENYTENLQINTAVKGTSTAFNVGLNTLAKFTVDSGAGTATLIEGSLQPNVDVVVSGQDPLGIYSGTTLRYDGTNYVLTATTTNSGYLTVNYTVSGTSPVALSGSSTSADLSSTISGLLNGTSIVYGNSIQVLANPVTSGFNTVTSGINVSFSQGIPWNVVIVSGANVTATNSITSQNPDAMFVYPQGNELVGLNIGSVNQTLLSNINDYTYIRPSGTPPLYLKINFNPLSANAPYTFTGQNIQLQSQYIPLCSRITVTGNNTQIVDSNYVDLFIDGQATLTVTEQAIINTDNIFTASGTGGSFDVNRFLTADGNYPTVGDYYITLTQGPVANFPYQVLSGNVPTALVFGKYSFPLVLTPTTTGTAVVATGIIADNVLYTTATGFNNLQVGMVASGVSATPTISGLTVGNYITGLIPGNPNQIVMSNNFTADVSGTITWRTVAYPVYDNTKLAGTMQDITGVAFRAIDPVGYGSGYWLSDLNRQSGSIQHDYYSDVVAVDNLVQQARTTGTDILVHQADYRRFIVNISISYATNSNPSNINSTIQNTVSQYFSLINFGDVVNLNGIVQAVYGTGGITAVRITTSSDSATSYGLQEVNIDGSVKPGNYTKDILLSSNEIAVLDHVNFFQFGQNNF